MAQEQVTDLRTERLDHSRLQDFWTLHSAGCGAGWCACVAWWVPTWEGWGERSAEQNRGLREELFERGEYDGYLLYEGTRVVAWCQVGPRDRLVKLCAGLGLDPDPRTWCISCILVREGERGRGLARRLLMDVLSDLGKRAVERIEAYPKADTGGDALGQWTGPEALYEQLGFQQLRSGSSRHVYLYAVSGAG